MLRRLSVVLVATAALFVAPTALACGGGGYSYAGVASTNPVSGVGATLTSLASPAVQNGHVAGWVGVGGAGLGPHGTDEWVQVGYSGFPGISVGSLYFEVALPGRAPQYHEVLSNVPQGETHRLAVLEVAHHPGWWRVWVDGHRVSRPYHLPGSAGAWRGVATAENWGGGQRACNEFAYRFAGVRVARAPGGTWRLLSTAYRLHTGDNHLIGNSASNFVVRTSSVPHRRARPAAAKKSPAQATEAQTAAPVAPTPPVDPSATAPPVDAAPPVDTAPPTDTSDGDVPLAPGSVGR